MRTKPLRAVKGMSDLLPDVLPRYRFLEEQFFAVAHRYGYAAMRTPIVEPTELFVRSIGEATDIVEKEMYTFVDKGDQSLTLRPEGTAGAVRAFIQHGVHADAPVTKWVYAGPMYRRERPAKGRYRQFGQLGAECFGDQGPYSDAELIALLLAFLRAVGAEGLSVCINSLGSAESRHRYREALVAFLAPHRDALSEESKARFARNPLRILDSKAPEDQALTMDAPSLLDFLGDEDRHHFEQLQGALTALGIAFEVTPKLVRGLDYYNRTLFEVKGDNTALGAQDTICGGGRYDTLVETLGGTPTPAVGFAIGIERLLLSTHVAPVARGLDAWIAMADPSLRPQGLTLLQTLRGATLSADADFRGTSLKSQLRRANKAGATFAVILGPDEVARETVQLRDLRAATQNELTEQALVEQLLLRRT